MSDYVVEWNQVLIASDRQPYTDEGAFSLFLGPAGQVSAGRFQQRGTMNHARGGMTTGISVDAASGFPRSVLRSRWALILALIALVAFGGQDSPTATEYVLLAAMVLSNLVLAYLRNRDLQMAQALEVIMVADVLVVTLLVGLVDPTPETYLAVFAALVLASALGRVGVIMPLMLLVCAVYAVYLYAEVGATFWRDVKLVLRVPFLFALGLHFASIASYLKSEKAQREHLLAKAKQHAERADQLAQEQDRLRALSHIGRLGLASAEAAPVRVLLEMAHRSKAALGATRCVIFLSQQDGREAAWTGHTKDRNTEVGTMPAGVGVEALRELLLNGKLTELHPGDSKKLMAKVKAFFPDSNPFGSLLLSPIEVGDALVGAVFLIDSDPARKYSAGERDFLWTVSLMAGAFIEARGRLENEIRLRTLITNAPVIMFALSNDGTIELFEGRGSEALGGRPADRIGKSVFDVADDPEAVRSAFDVAVGGRLVAGTLSLDGTVFETQYSPLRGVGGGITGVMGVTTAILTQEQPSASSAAATGTQPPLGYAAPTGPSIAPDAAPPFESVEPESEPRATAGGSANGERPDPNAPGKTVFPTPRPDLKPRIPLADEDAGDEGS